MRIEVLCTGDELLTGIAADTNSPFFMEKALLSLGQRVRRVTVVGDVPEQIAAALLELAQRCDAVLVCGGLGPTSDDVTLESAAAAAGVPLIEDAQTLGWIRERFVRLGLPMTPNNARQARLPKGARAVRNPVGTAPLVLQRIGECAFFFVPGVPREYRHLVEHEVLPRLAEQVAAEAGRTFWAMRVLKTVGLPESKLDALVEPLRSEHPKVNFGFRTQAPENHLKLLAGGQTKPEAHRAVEGAAAACRALLAPWLFGEGDQTLAGAIGSKLRARSQTVALAESCSGGLGAGLLTAIPGASEWFVGSAVVYQPKLKQRWAGVSASSLAAYGAVSGEVALEMAAGVRAQCEATYGVAVTGYAGPGGGTEQDPVGTFYCALSSAAGGQVQRGRVDGERERVRQFAAFRALEMLWRAVEAGE